MGITAFSISLLEKAIAVKPDIKDVLEFGAQCLYLHGEETPPFADVWYKEKGLRYFCIDMAGDNGAKKLNWSRLIHIQGGYSLITDLGSSEHSALVEHYKSESFHDGKVNSVYPSGLPHADEIAIGFYNCWLNKHNLLKVGGIMVNENPLTGHWIDHCYSWIGSNFYQELSLIAGYEIIETGIHFAMGNTESGGNVYSILRKTNEIFPSFTEFYAHLPIYRS